MIKLIKPDGAVEYILNSGRETTLDLLYHLLDCDTIEVPGGGFRTADGDAVQFVVDEEGKLRGKPVNGRATEAYDKALAEDPRGLVPGRDTLVGNVVILTWPNLLT